MSGKKSLFNIILGYTTAFSITLYLVWRLFFTLPVSYGYLSIALGALLLLCEVISGVQAVMNYLDQINPLPLELPDIPESWYPDVDILIATHDEEVNLMYNTINACRYLDYPDKSKVHIHLCDDGNRPEMRALAERLGVNYIDMPVPKFAKAGNMNNALAQTNSPLLAFLDADMVPRREFLMRLAPYFFLPKMKKNEQGEWVERTPEEIDPKYEVGFVQSPQNFYNPDLFQYNLHAENRVPNEQIYFFREINVSRNRHNSALLCGSNMMISRKALAEVGYFSTNNITEDHETGIKIQNAGYTTYAIAECLANGLNPPAVINLIVQRERWGRGCMQTVHNVKPYFDRRVPFMRKIHILCSQLYWLTFFSRFIFIVTPILVALFGVFVVECSLGEVLMFWLPYYLLHTYAMSKLSDKTRTTSWSNTVDTIMFPFLAVPIILDMVGIRLKKFRVTDKGHQRHTSANPIMILPHIILLGLSVVGIVMSVLEIVQYGAVYNIIILFWLVVNAKSLILSVFFMQGRINDRYFYRFNVDFPVEVEVKGRIFTGRSVDISEGGFSLALDFPALLPTEETVTVRLFDRGYRAEAECRMLQVKRDRNHNWVYGMKVEQIEEDQLSQFRQIIYERDPTLPEFVNETISGIEDIKVNLDRRLAKQVALASRKYPRIVQPIHGVLADGSPVTLSDFNYHYVQAHGLEPLSHGETATVTLDQGVFLVLTAPEERLAGLNRHLFQVVNWQDWAENSQYTDVIARWAGTRISAEPVEVEVVEVAQTRNKGVGTGVRRRPTGGTGKIVHRNALSDRGGKTRRHFRLAGK